MCGRVHVHVHVRVCVLCCVCWRVFVHMAANERESHGLLLHLRSYVVLF